MRRSPAVPSEPPAVLGPCRGRPDGPPLPATSASRSPRSPVTLSPSEDWVVPRACGIQARFPARCTAGLPSSHWGSAPSASASDGSSSHYIFHCLGPVSHRFTTKAQFQANTFFLLQLCREPQVPSAPGRSLVPATSSPVAIQAASVPCTTSNPLHSNTWNSGNTCHIASVVTGTFPSGITHNFHATQCLSHTPASVPLPEPSSSGEQQLLPHTLGQPRLSHAFLWQTASNLFLSPAFGYRLVPRFDIPLLPCGNSPERSAVCPALHVLGGMSSATASTEWAQPPPTAQCLPSPGHSSLHGCIFPWPRLHWPGCLG